MILIACTCLSLQRPLIALRNDPHYPHLSLPDSTYVECSTHVRVVAVRDDLITQHPACVRHKYVTPLFPLAPTVPCERSETDVEVLGCC